MSKPESIMIDNVRYVREDQVKAASMPNKEGLKYVIIRTYSAGVFAGYLKSKGYTQAGVIVELMDARRLWYWEGAASLSQMAMSGTSKPGSCKFPEPVKSVELTAIEILETTKQAQDSINSVPVWKA